MDYGIRPGEKPRGNTASGRAMAAEPLSCLEGVSKIYRPGPGQVPALRGVSLAIRQGEFVAIVGQSGSGKSTLMNLLGCLDTPSQGVCRIGGRDLSALDGKSLSAIRNREIGFIFQGFHLIPGLTAAENVELPLRYRGTPKGERRRLAARALERVGLEDRAGHRPGEMSGGQQQRVAIARAIAARPPILLADEPTGNLDVASGREVMSILRELWREGRTLVLITHDPAIAASAPRVITISDGRIVADSAQAAPALS